jgi:hypothetical protein
VCGVVWGLNEQSLVYHVIAANKYVSQPTTTQLSGARSTTELIARCAGLLKGGLLRQKREKLHPFPFDILMLPHGGHGDVKKDTSLFCCCILSLRTMVDLAF